MRDYQKWPNWGGGRVNGGEEDGEKNKLLEKKNRFKNLKNQWNNRTNPEKRTYFNCGLDIKKSTVSKGGKLDKRWQKEERWEFLIYI